VEIEVPRGGLVKWGADGGVDLVSPLPCPFNYGAVTGVAGGDGDPLDAVVLGKRLSRGHVGIWPVQGVIRFVDDGFVDDKLVCGARPLRNREKFGLLAFFYAYGALKPLLKRLRNADQGRTGVLDYEWR